MWALLVVRCMYLLVFFKQKTAYEMRISDWSSDVYSSDLLRQQVDAVLGALQPLGGADDADIVPHEAADFLPIMLDDDLCVGIGDAAFVPRARSEQRRVGQECGSTGRSRWLPYYYTEQQDTHTT